MSLLREPMVHFFALAALLFVLEAGFSAEQKSRILVDQATADYLIRRREDLELRVLDPAERANVIDAYVEDEILYREAYRRGLDQGDSRMRRNLVLKMRGLITGELDPPDEAELRRFFEANRDRFVRPARYDIEQVLFEADAVIPDDLDAALAAGTIGTRRQPGMTQSLLASTFGADAGRAILTAAGSEWLGPFAMPDGVQYLRVVDRIPEQTAEYEAVQAYLAGDWMMDKSRALIREEVNRVASDYEVVIEADL